MAKDDRQKFPAKPAWSAKPRKLFSTINEKFFYNTFITECKATANLAWPAVVIEISLYLFGPVSIIVCGHLGAEQLGGASVAFSIFSITGVYIGYGLCMACDTYFSQSFGSPNKKQLGRYLQKCLVTILLCVLPCWAVHINAERILTILGQDPFVSRVSGQLLQLLMPGLVGNFLYQVLAKYLLNQDIIYPPVVIGAVGNVAHAVLQYLFVYTFNWGITGSGIAQSIGYWILFLLTLGYILVSKVYVTTWNGWNLRDCLSGWWKIYSLALPGMVMTVVEWGSFEICLFLSGLLSVREQAAFAIILQLEAVSYLIPLGVGVATSIRIGQHLGANDREKAVSASRVGFTIILITASVATILLASLRTELPKIFTHDQLIIYHTSNMLLVLVTFQYCDGIVGVCSGICRGTGHQFTASLIIFTTFFLFGMPLAGCLAFLTPLRVAGLWTGMAIAVFVETILMGIFAWRMNWTKEIEEAQERIGIAEDNHNKTDIPLKLSSESPSSDDTTYLLNGDQRRKPTIYSLIVRRTFIVSALLALFLFSLFLRLLYPVQLSLVSTNATNSTQHFYGYNFTFFHGQIFS